MEALNIQAGQYVDPEGRPWPIVKFFNEDGYECTSNEAVSCVAGEGARWFAINIADFEGRPQ